jgi:hypothetical protein
MITLILWIALVGLVAYLVVTYIPMPKPFANAIIVIALLCVLFYVLQRLGVVDMPVPRLH